MASFSVNEVRRCFIKAAAGSPEPYSMPVSYLDSFVNHTTVTLFYAYDKPTSGAVDFAGVVYTIETSLAEILVHYHPLAGRVLRNPNSGQDEIHFENQGAEMIIAAADVALSCLDFHDLDKSVGKLLLPPSNGVPLVVRVMSFTCGGFTISCSIDHMLGDAKSILTFMISWAELARGKNLSPAMLPNHDRSILRCHRTPPMISKLIEETISMCTFNHTKEILTRIALTDPGCIQRLYFVDGSCLERLRSSANEGGVSRTKTEAFTSYLWKIMAKAFTDVQEHCTIGWTVDGRQRISTVDGKKKSLSNYCGNVISFPLKEVKVEDLNRMSLSEVTEIAAETIKKATSEEHFKELVDWISCRRSDVMVPRMLMKGWSPVLAVAACHNLPAMSPDFGFGSPAVGTFYHPMPGMGYMNMISSGRGDGSWVVFMSIWPAVAAALESDPDHVCRPFKAIYLDKDFHLTPNGCAT